MKRKLEISVVSDVHLGTYGCHAKELVNYLRSIDPKILILNGDIIDTWQFNKKYFPSAHMLVIKEFINLMNNGTKVVYITGNHDEVFRKYSGLVLGNFSLVDKYLVDIDGKKAWFFHGDIFDLTTKGTARILAKIGGKGYDLLILMNRAINRLLEFFNKEKLSISKKIKNSIKKAVSFINDFEQIAAEHAISKGYHYVVCGHIHQPQNRIISNESGKVNYLNSGDWVENLTALEFINGEWTIYQYQEDSIEEIYFNNNSTIENSVFDFEIQEVNLLLNQLI